MARLFFKSVLAGIVLSSAALSCRVEPLLEESVAADVKGTPLSITVGTETKTVLCDDGEEAGAVHWCGSDRIKIFNEAREGCVFATVDTNCSKAIFTCDSWYGGTPKIAVHSFLASKSSCIKLDGTDTAVRTYLNPVQLIYDKKTFSKDASASIGLVRGSEGAWSIDRMMNVFSLVQFRVQDTSIVRIKMKGAGNETLAGWMDVDYNGGNPVWTEVSGQDDSQSRQIVVTATADACKEKNSGRFQAEVPYYIAVLPQTLSGGFTLEIEKENGATATRTISSSVTLKRNTILPISSAIDKDLIFSEPEGPFTDPDGPRDLDFSRVGYHWGDTDIPEYPVGLTIGPDDIAAALSRKEFPDTTSFLNDAIAGCPSGTALLLKAGEYHIHSSLQILRSDMAIRGEGNTNTLIIAARCPSEDAYSCLLVGAATASAIESSVARITDEHVPVGAMYVDVDSPGLFSRGDNVTVRRKATKEWIHDIKMDQIDDTHQWTDDLESFNIVFDRRVMKVVGTRVYFDSPVPMDLDLKYTVSYIWKSSHNRIREVGVENIGFVADYDSSDPFDENHASSAVVARSCEHCWIKGVSGRHFKTSTVRLVGGARNVTVENCKSLEPVSLMTGSRRYAFAIGDGAENCLVRDCTADNDRHMFVSPNRSNGPNVFLRCTGTNCQSNGGPHCYWATLFLYDNVTLDGKLSVEDVGGEAELTSHGWQGANHVLWNCTASSIVCQSPWATGLNYAYGCVGTKEWGSYFNGDPRGMDPSTWVKGDNWRPDGVWYPEAGGGEALSSRVMPESLYESQLEKRHSDGVFIYPLPNPQGGKEDGRYTIDVNFISEGHGYSPFVGIEAVQNKALVLTDRSFSLKSDPSVTIEFKATKLRLIWGKNNGLETTVADNDYINVPQVDGCVLYSASVTTNNTKSLDISLVDSNGNAVGENALKGTPNFFAFTDEDKTASKLLFHSSTGTITYSCITRIVFKYRQRNET